MKKNNGNNKTEEIRELVVNPKLPPIWIDFIDPSIRNDGIGLLRLSTNLPEGAIEQGKFITNKEALIDFINVLSFALDYYPDKDTIQKGFETSPKQKKSSKK